METKPFNVTQGGVLIQVYRGGGLDLSGLTSAKDLILPKTVGGGLDLSGLTSAKDLILPKTASGGWLDLSDSVRKEFELMSQSRPTS